MANVFDVAQYILKTVQEPITPAKLHLILYYSQAWHSVWSDNPLFSENIYKTPFGVSVPELHPYTSAGFKVESLPVGVVSNLTEDETDSVDYVLAFYNVHETHWLRDLITSEDPWKNTTVNEVITLRVMYDYYSSL